MTAKRTPAKTAAAARAAARAQHDTSTESGRIAHEILQQFSDLAPSVNKIMGAGLSEQGQLRAIDAFRVSLTTPGDPMRNPANAIDAGRSVDGTD